MTITTWTDAHILREPVAPVTKRFTRSLLCVTGTAICSISLNAGLLIGLLYWASVLE